MKFQAAIFDMDGLLIDSELYLLELETAFLSKYHIPFSQSLKNIMYGKSWVEVLAMLKAQFNLAPPVSELIKEKEVLGRAIHDYQAQKMPGSDEILQKLKSAGYKLAVASGSPEERICTIVERMGWKQLFDTLVSVEHVDNKGKPHPAVYQRAIFQLGEEPQRCVALEDSVNGVRSAKGAGMSCVAVPDARWSYGDFTEADLVANSLADQRLFEFIGL